MTFTPNRRVYAPHAEDSNRAQAWPSNKRLHPKATSIGLLVRHRRRAGILRMRGNEWDFKWGDGGTYHPKATKRGFECLTNTIVQPSPCLLSNREENAPTDAFPLEFRRE